MTSSNAVKLNINTLETIENEFNIDFINEINTNRTVFEQETFEINETDIGFDENFESDSEFDSFESEDEEIPDNNDESDIIIEQKKSNNLTSCVLINKIDGKIQRCKNKESFRTLWQLVGVWQIDNEGVSEVNGSLEKLGVCSYHFNHDQNKLHDSNFKKKKSTASSILCRRRCLFCGKLFYFFGRGNGCSKHSRKLLGKSIQVACNGQYTCPALGECNLICKPALEDTKYSRYICSECYELEGGHFHVKPGKGKLLETCIDQKYHDEDPKKNLEIIARWLFYVKNNKNKEYQEKVLGIFLPTYLQFLNANYSYEINTEIVSNQSQSITTSSNTSHNFFIPTLLKLPTFFMVRVLTRLNQIPIYPDEKELEDDDFEKLGKLAGDKLWQSYKRLKTNKIYLQSPTNITEYIDAFPKFLKIFFEKMFLQLESKKIIRSNQYKILHNKPLKKSDPQKINKTISFLLSVTVGYAFPYFDLWLPTILSSLCRRPKLISSLHALLTKCSIIGHTSRHERRLEKVRMKDIDPTKRLIRGNNVFNLAIIDNIDFKEVSFGFGNIYDVTRGTSHATLRMVFQSTLPILTNETPEPVRELNVDTQLFGMTSGMHTMQAKIDQTFEKLLNFQMDINGNISYNKNLDVEIIEKEILSKCEFDPYNYDRNDRKVNNRIDPLWKLIENLVEIFQMDNYTDHELFKKNPPSQLTPEGLKKLSSAYNEGLKRIKEVYCQEVIKTERINTKGRRHLEIVKTDIRSVKSSQKRKIHQENPSTSQSNKNSQQSSTLNDENPAPKRQRIITTDEEKEILNSLLLKDTMPTETEINNVLINLPAEWDSQRVKRYYNNNKMSKKKK
ncbi:unnamed protein product [Rhizophagus irregularis]|nr:unnamed protein product [Rhizophagus irregularis]